MKVLAKYGLEIDEQVYVCEVSFDEMARITKDDPVVSKYIEVDDVNRLAAEVREARERVGKIVRLAVRSESLLQSLNAELDAARLSVDDRALPDVAVIRAHVAYLKTLTEE